MTSQNSDSPFSVLTREAAEALADPKTQRFMEPFMARERSVSQAAHELGIATNSLLYRVKKLTALDLLRVVRVEARAGRPIKIYRASSDSFFVPFVLTRAETLEALFLKLDDYMQGLFYKNAVRALSHAPMNLGFTFGRSAEGVVKTRLAAGSGELFDPLKPETPAFLPYWSPELWLDPADAKELVREMISLTRRYHGRSGKQRHILHLAISPVVEE